MLWLCSSGLNDRYCAASRHCLLNIMNIELLANHQDVIPQLVNWFELEWEPYYGRNGPGEAQSDLASRCRTTSLPLGLIAIENGKILATAAIDKDVSTNLSPSIVGLLVSPEFRHQGIATSLIKASEKWAIKLGFCNLYVSTVTLGNLFINLGWSQLDKIEFLNAERGFIYVKEL